jgi:hypothetical protein
MGNLTTKNDMKKRMILGVVIAMLGASSASAEELSPSAKRGVAAADGVVTLVDMFAIRPDREMVPKSFGPCNEVGEMLECKGLLFSWDANGSLHRMHYWVMDGDGLVIGEWVAAASFRLNDKLGVNFKKGEYDTLEWFLPGLRFFVQIKKEAGIAFAGVERWAPPEEKEKKEPEAAKQPKEGK